MKRVVSTLLALVLVLALAGTAAAAGEGSITIDNAVVGKTYTIYRIFDLDSHSEDYQALNYKVSAKWTAFFEEGAEGLNYVDIDELGYVTWKENASAADFAAKAFAFAKAQNIANDGQKTADSSTVAFTGLDLGYYLVQSDLGALCSLDTTMPSVTIKEKNSEPTVEKKVKEDSTGAFGETNDADRGIQNHDYRGGRPAEGLCAARYHERGPDLQWNGQGEDRRPHPDGGHGLYAGDGRPERWLHL